MKTIRIARTRAGLTQKKLAELVDRDQSEISRIEAGKTALTVTLEPLEMSPRLTKVTSRETGGRGPGDWCSGISVC